MASGLQKRVSFARVVNSFATSSKLLVDPTIVAPSSMDKVHASKFELDDSARS